jgi:hypothetical protein
MCTGTHVYRCTFEHTAQCIPRYRTCYSCSGTCTCNNSRVYTVHECTQLYSCNVTCACGPAARFFTRAEVTSRSLAYTLAHSRSTAGLGALNSYTPATAHFLLHRHLPPPQLSRWEQTLKPGCSAASATLATCVGKIVYILGL